MVKKENNNLRKGIFNEKELIEYKLTEAEIKVVMDYQELFPILQEDNDTWISARILHEQLGVGRDFTTWIKQQIEDLDLEEEKEFNMKWQKDNIPFKGDASNSNKMSALGYNKEYFITVEIAKQVAMVAGAKGGRTGAELKERSKIARKYFIYIEKAFKNRIIWNGNRIKTIEKFHDLKKVVFRDLFSDNKLGKYIPEWWNYKVRGRNNTYAYELYLIDLIIINMSASQYRQTYGLKGKISIRNTFDKQQLEYVQILERKDVEYLMVNELWNTDKRMNQLRKFYELYKQGKIE